MVSLGGGSGGQTPSTCALSLLGSVCSPHSPLLATSPPFLPPPPGAGSPAPSPRLLPSPSSQTLPLQVWEAAKELDCQGIIGPTISFDFFFFFLLNSSKSLKGIP